MWCYDASARNLALCEHKEPCRKAQCDLAISQRGSDLFITERGVMRQWRPGDYIERDGVRYRLPKAFHVEVLYGGYAAPWRIERAGSGLSGKP
jgi:hypothetical protein